MTTTYKTWFHTRLATLIFPRQTLPSVFVYRAPDLSLMDKGTFSSAPGDTAHGSQCESPSPWNFKPLYPKTHPAHVHSAHLSSRSEFLTVSPFHRTSPNFAFFCLRSYLLPWWHLPRQGVFQARQKKKRIKNHTSLLWGIGNIGSLRVCRDLFHDVGSESIHGNLWGNWTCSPQFHHFHGFFLGQHMSYNSFHGWSGSFCPPIWPFTTPRNPKGCLFMTYLKPPTSGKFIDCKTTLSFNQNFFVISAWIPKYSYKDLL